MKTQTHVFRKGDKSVRKGDKSARGMSSSSPVLAVISTLALQTLCKLPAHTGAIKLRSDSNHGTFSLIVKPEINRHVGQRIVHYILKNDA